MQLYNSAVPMILSPVGKNITKPKVPFLPHYYWDYRVKNAASLTKVNETANQISPSKNFLSRFKNQVFQWVKRRDLKLIGIVVPMTLLISVELYLPFYGQHQSQQQLPNYNTVTVDATNKVSLNNIATQKTLTVVTTQNKSTYFGSDGFEHGFGHDIVSNYANRLGVNLKTLVVANEQQALNAVKQGQADMILSNLPSIAANDEKLTTLNISCGNDFLSQQGLNPKTSIILPNTDKRFVMNTYKYLCDGKVLKTNEQLASFYNANVFDSQYSQDHFVKTMANELPNYRQTFQKSAQQHNLDWELLVAMGYQESQLQADAVSPTGVRGIMMLTNDTAAAMGVTDRVDGNQSIHGGARYMQQLTQQFADIPSSDRLWFTLASYNMGPQAIRDIQVVLQQQGLNPNSWAEVYRYLSEHRQENSRYVQCIQYVTHIRGYLEALKLSNIANDKKVA